MKGTPDDLHTKFHDGRIGFSRGIGIGLVNVHFVNKWSTDITADILDSFGVYIEAGTLTHFLLV